MKNNFNKLYNNILKEANLNLDKWIQISTYRGVQKYYSKDHVEKRIEQRYSEEDIDVSKINYLLNRFINELLRRNAWKGINLYPKSISLYAEKSKIWFSGEIQKEKETQKKQFCLATMQPSEEPDINLYDIIIRLPI